MPACRIISDRTARSTERSELTFLVSVRVPHSLEPIGMSEVFTSQRRLPSSILTSETPRVRRMSRSSRTYTWTTAGLGIDLDDDDRRTYCICSV